MFLKVQQQEIEMRAGPTGGKKGENPEKKKCIANFKVALPIPRETYKAVGVDYYVYRVFIVADEYLEPVFEKWSKICSKKIMGSK